MSSSESRIRLVFRSRLARVLVAVLGTVGLAAAIAGPAAHSAGAGQRVRADETVVDTRIGANHNQVLV